MHTRRGIGACRGTRRPHTTTIIAATALTALGLAVPVGLASAHAPVAHIAGKCSLVGKYQSLGPTYVESLSVSGTSCGTGVSVIKAYNACRLKHGGKAGYCNVPVLGFRCRERRTTSPVQYVAAASCTKARASVKFSYSENT